MTYRVIVRFKDLHDDNHLYSVGDTFPRPGVIVTDGRLKELSTNLNRRGIPLIEKVQEAKKTGGTTKSNKRPKRK